MVFPRSVGFQGKNRWWELKDSISSNFYNRLKLVMLFFICQLHWFYDNFEMSLKCQAIEMYAELPH